MPPTLLPTTQIAVSNEPPCGAGNCHGTTDLSTHSALSDEQCTNFAIFMQNAVRARTAPGWVFAPPQRPHFRPNSPQFGAKNYLGGGQYRSTRLARCAHPRAHPRAHALPYRAAGGSSPCAPCAPSSHCAGGCSRSARPSPPKIGILSLLQR